ncbi:MAG: DUF4271 domain-containing protein [Saprospiraceae bacterium]|nr:DUF4271 domain-containing protein [Saprospiraceae bacterium]
MLVRRFIALFFFGGVCLGLSAQEIRLNPFDLLGRLPKGVAAAALPALPADSVYNPFNVVSHRTPGASRGISASMESTFRPLEILPHGDAISTTFLFWLLVALVAFLSFSVATKRNVVVKAWRGFLNESSLTLAQREAAGPMGSAPYFLLYVSFLLNAGAFIFLIARFFSPKMFNNFGFLAICMLSSFGLFLSKHVLLRLVNWLFPVDAEVRRYNFLIIIFNCVLGLFLVPFNFLVAFAQAYQGFLVFWTLGLAAVFYAYRSLRATAIGQKFFSGHLFHFLLYLCTIEIAPVIILIKLAMLASK